MSFYKVGINYMYDTQRFHNRFILEHKNNDFFIVMGPQNDLVFHEQLSYERKLFLESDLLQRYVDFDQNPFDQSKKLNLYDYVSVHKLLLKLSRSLIKDIMHLERSHQLISTVHMASYCDFYDCDWNSGVYGDIFEALEDARDCSFKSMWHQIHKGMD